MLITAYPRAIAYVGSLWQPISLGRAQVLGLLKPGCFDNRFLSLPALRNDRSSLIAFLEIERVPNEQRPVPFKNWWWGNQRLKPRALVKPRRGITLYTLFLWKGPKTLSALRKRENPGNTPYKKFFCEFGDFCPPEKPFCPPE